MSLQTSLEYELNHRTPQQIGMVQVSNGNAALSLNLLQIDPLGVAFQSFVCETPMLANTPTKQLTAMADQLARQLTYLLEPLRVIEIDGAAGAVQMRSSQPMQSPSRTCYYEILVRRGGSISLDRYEKQPGQARQVIPAILTREVLLRLTSDVQGVLS